MVFERKYDDEVKRRSVARVLERRAAEPGNRAVLREVAEEFDIGAQSLRVWVRRADAAESTVLQATRLRDPVTAPAPSPAGEGTAETLSLSRAALIRRVQELEREVQELRSDNAVLTRAAAIFAAGLPHLD